MHILSGFVTIELSWRECKNSEYLFNHFGLSPEQLDKKCFETFRLDEEKSFPQKQTSLKYSSESDVSNQI